MTGNFGFVIFEMASNLTPMKKHLFLLLLCLGLLTPALHAQVAHPDTLCQQWLTALLSGKEADTEALMPPLDVYSRLAKALYIKEFGKKLNVMESDKVGRDLAIDMKDRARQRFAGAMRYLSTHRIADKDIALLSTQLTPRKTYGDLQEHRMAIDLQLHNGAQHHLEVDLLQGPDGWYIASGVIAPYEWDMEGK
jgi:hypothetical protein